MDIDILLYIMHTIQISGYNVEFINKVTQWTVIAKAKAKAALPVHLNVPWRLVMLTQIFR